MGTRLHKTTLVRLPPGTRTNDTARMFGGTKVGYTLLKIEKKSLVVKLS
jgi:hypothetical protein